MSVFLFGVVFFTASSILCGFATSSVVLIVGRALQGVGAAFLVPGSLAIISATFDDAERGRAIGTWSGFSAITTAIGPVIGGWLIEHVSWRAAFFINLPLAVVVVRRTRRRAVPVASQSHSGSALHSHTSRCGSGAFRNHHVRVVALGGRTGESGRCETPPDCRAPHRRVRHRVICAYGDRRFLLDEHLSGGVSAGNWNDDHRCAADDDRDGGGRLVAF